VRSPLTAPLALLAEEWRTVTRASRVRAAGAGVGLVWALALLLARQGTLRARVAAGVAMGLSVAVAVAWRIVERRRLREPEGVVRALARAVDPQRAERALRALTLVDAAGEVRAGGTSPDLARLHVARTLAQIPSERIVERAVRLSARLAGVAVVLAVCVAGLVVARGWSLLEGGDVLAARHGLAPLEMHWLDATEVVTRPPDYLHQPEQHELSVGPRMLPFGTTVTLRGVPLHAGRRLLLGDGATEVPFVEDGTGAVVARWTLERSTLLYVFARFGDVAVRDPDALELQSIPDQPPVVVLEGAPGERRLVDATEDIPLRYVATDDHGLREVHLVLRSGLKEERRELAHLDGETTRNEGGQVLRLRDPFLRKSHAPIQITVEAKDNDPLTGPKWGASPAITLIPPDVGEPEARRLDALRMLRDQLVDTLAWRVSNEVPGQPSWRKIFLNEERTRTDADELKLRAVAAGVYGGVRIAARLVALLTAQSQKVHTAIGAEARSPTAPTHAAVVKATERYVLVVDAVIHGLGFHDTRESAKQLADVADDLAQGASQMQGQDRDARTRAGVRMDAARTVLDGGGRIMLRLGSLGQDIGEIVDTDLLRVQRARGEEDFVHAELAARDLAARLREPDPSFGARGRTGRGGGESGGGRGTPGEEGGDSGDEVDEAQQEAAQDLERLTEDHAGEIAKTEQALSGATSDDEMKELREEAKRHAEAVREAVKDLPTVGMGSDSWTSKGAAARELAEQMAHSLEDARPDEAVQSGRSSLGSLDEAKKMLQRGAWFEDPNGQTSKRVDEATRKLAAEEKWAEEALRQLRQRAAERARKPLEQGGGEEEQLAERARELARRTGEKGSLPQEAVDSIEDAEHAAQQAAQALKAGEADKGLERQREAQRDLEKARQALQGDEDTGNQASADGDGQRSPSKAPVAIPGAGDHKGPEEFRRRVVRGLGQPSSGALKDAVRRYAEGLLR
jgi:hypothetical protein